MAETATKAGSEAAPNQDLTQQLSKAQEELVKSKEEVKALKEEMQKKQQEVSTVHQQPLYETRQRLRLLYSTGLTPHEVYVLNSLAFGCDAQDFPCHGIWYLCQK